MYSAPSLYRPTDNTTITNTTTSRPSVASSSAPPRPGGIHPPNQPVSQVVVVSGWAPSIIINNRPTDLPEPCCPFHSFHVPGTVSYSLYLSLSRSMFRSGYSAPAFPSGRVGCRVVGLKSVSRWGIRKFKSLTHKGISTHKLLLLLPPSSSTLPWLEFGSEPQQCLS